MRFTLLASLALMIGSAVPAGCDSAEAGADSGMVLAAPLPLDPESPVELGRWWYDGDQLLRLDPDGCYALFAEGNRHRAPASRGLWSRPSYKSIRLEPYLRRTPRGDEARTVRVEIVLVDEAIGLQMPGRPVMVALEEAPRTLEDELIGTWSHAGEWLVLESDMRYRLADASGRSRGAWIAEGGAVRLVPDVPGRPVAILELERGESGHVLISSAGTFARAAD